MMHLTLCLKLKEMALQLLLYLNHKSINYSLSHPCMCVNTKHTQTRINRSGHTCTRSHAHKEWPHCGAISSSTPSWVSSDVSLIFFLSLCFHFPSFYGKRQMDGEEGRAGEGRGGAKEKPMVFSFSLFPLFPSFFFESKVNLNSVLPYADLQRNVPYAQKFIKQYRRQTLSERKY